MHPDIVVVVVKLLEARHPDNLMYQSLIAGILKSPSTLDSHTGLRRALAEGAKFMSISRCCPRGLGAWHIASLHEASYIEVKSWDGLVVPKTCRSPEVPDTHRSRSRFDIYCTSKFNH